MTRRTLAAVPLVLAALLASLEDDARGCAPAPRAGESVDVAEETALVVWDEEADTEHFVRQATFVGTARDFGFLVPTPNRPQVEPADPDVFRELARITEPRTEHRTETSLRFGCGAADSHTGHEKADSALPGGVVVLEQKRVGNLDAAVLGFRADKTQRVEDTADELLGWLASRGYAARPELTEWLAPYIRDNWVITAFKIAGDPKAEAPGGGSVAVRGEAVRMSFKTDRPFFPYREPADQRDRQSGAAPRLLRLFVAAKERMAGTIGESTPWPGQTVFANAVGDGERGTILGKLDLPSTTLPAKWWLTEFEDHSAPRQGIDELYLERSMDRGTVARPPVVHTTYKTPWWAGPLAVILLLALGGAGFALVRRFTGGDLEEEELPVTPPPLPNTEPRGPTAPELGNKFDPPRWP